MKKIFSVLSMGVLAVSLVGCDSITKQDVGVVTGGAAGALLGSQFGQGSGQAVAIAAGAVLGALVGGQIGKYMDKTDQLEMNQALESTKTGQSKSWQNPDNGNRYTVKPTKTYHQDSQPCREYTTTAWIGGKKQQVYGQACRKADGSWEVVK